MPIKTRPWYGSYKIGPDTYPYASTGERIETYNSVPIKGLYIAFQPCTHYKTLQASNCRDRSSGIDYNISFLANLSSNILPILHDECLKRAYLQLDFQKNNNFEIIPFLVDWDSTLAMFSTKFIKQISYGSVTWGVAPFLSDLKSLYASLRDVESGLEASYSKIVGKKISRRCPVAFTYTDLDFNYDVKGYIAYNGYVGAKFPDSPLDALGVFLDEIGLHPDLKTVWDVIPLSFVLDYFLPLGDILESIHPRGWFNPMFTLSGGYSVKFTVELRGNAYYDGNGGVYTSFVRKPGELELPSRPTIDVAYKCPSLLQLFNTLYLGFSSKR